MGRRPAIDVVVPFRGSNDERATLLERLQQLRLRERDVLMVVDNGPAIPPGMGEDGRLMHAPELPSSYFARNRGAEHGSASWLVFLDADVAAPADLLDRYFDPPPGDRVAVMAGGFHDEPISDLGRASIAERFAVLKGHMDQENTMLRPGGWNYAQTANFAVRREAFEAVGGFDEQIRSGGDADLCFRLRQAGWELEPRLGAAVVHQNRVSLRALVRQKARHGSGAAWLNGAYPGAFPGSRSLAGVAWWSVRQLASAAWAGGRGRRDDALVGAVDVLCHWAFELGRLLPNTPRAHSRPAALTTELGDAP